ncbi:Na-translocating system protein MpsC family protein [Bacillus cabrialesii]
MSKKIHGFNDIIRKLRKELFGKGPERIHTVFVENMAVSTLYGNLSASEQFIARTPEGREMVQAARTSLIQDLYSKQTPEGMEELIGAKLVHLFSDIKIEENIAVSVFVFDQKIDDQKEAL